MQTPDVMIHLNDSLNRDQQQTIEAGLREIEGVIAPRFNKPHLLVVLYDSDKTNSTSLLKKVTSLGHQAHLVGL
jgi:hypothetical protein